VPKKEVEDVRKLYVVAMGRNLPEVGGETGSYELVDLR
jgi:hypothetical protein